MVDFAEVIDKNVEGITPEQKGVLVGLFQNVINERVADIYRGIDNDIAEATGSTKPAGMKTHEFIKSELAKSKEATEKAAKEANAAAADKIARLESLVEKAKKEGAGNARVAQLEKEVQDAKDIAEDLKAQHAKELAEREEKYTGLNNKYRKAETRQHLAGLAFRTDIEEDLRDLAVNSAVDYVLSLQAEEDSEGNTIYRDGNGKLLTNKENNMAPYTTAELLQSRLGAVIDKGRKQTGTGTKAGAGGSGGGGGAFVLNAKTQAEAMEQVTQHLYSEGIPQGDPRHQEFIDTAWKENNVLELPIQ